MQDADFIQNTKHISVERLEVLANQVFVEDPDEISHLRMCAVCRLRLRDITIEKRSPYPARR